MVMELTTDQNGAAYQHSLPVPEDKLSEEGPCEDISSDDQSSSFNEWILPAKEFDGLWERTEAKEGEQEHSDGRPIALALFRL
ncbi:hypothetical protein JHK82_055795 [Glycine max]|nr:hypothetical protein JHK85_056621 [Glycine max]KAG5074428.1 hypothetical protein JHK84_055659 [Glycine max]KAG5077100.1 hypothetical protein JHK82_055795 [Glycine max]